MSFFTEFFRKLFASTASSEADTQLPELTPEDRSRLATLDPRIVVGKILTIRSHTNPEITKVRITTCDIGDGKPTQILCGGTNIAIGQIVPIATMGAQLAPDFIIAVRTIKEESSNGMICARSELGLSPAAEQKGEIWVLPAFFAAKLGTPMCRVA